MSDLMMAGEEIKAGDAVVIGEDKKLYRWRVSEEEMLKDIIEIAEYRGYSTKDFGHKVSEIFEIDFLRLVFGDFFVDSEGLWIENRKTTGQLYISWRWHAQKMIVLENRVEYIYNYLKK